MLKSLEYDGYMKGKIRFVKKIVNNYTFEKYR